jgi:predicted amidophosphoribosyltransferase
VPDSHPRMARESRTVEAMVTIYCRGHHGTRRALCLDCRELLDYARERLDKCPFQEGKTTCANCPVHCYRPAEREKIRAVMRYAGPRMPFRHPILTLFHFFDGLRKQPIWPERERRDP